MNKDEAKKLAELARLEIADDELEKIAKDMGSVLEYIDKIKTADIPEGDELRIENAGVRNVMVPDENPHETGINTEKLLKEVPEAQDYQIKVKKIL